MIGRRIARRARPEADLDHTAAAAGAEIDPPSDEQGVTLAIIDGFGDRRRLWERERGADACELGGAAGVAKEAEVADAAELVREDVEEEAANELVGVERHCLGFVADAVILPAEADAAVLAGEETTIGDGDAMGIAAEIVEHLLGSAERAFGVDDPGDAAQGGKVAGEGGRFGECGEIAEEAQPAVRERIEQAFEEKAAVEPREDVDWQEEAGAAGDPTSIGREAAARHDAMDVRVMGQGLAPAMQDRDHADLGAEMFGIGADGADRLGRGLEEIS